MTVWELLLEGLWALGATAFFALSLKGPRRTVPAAALLGIQIACSMITAPLFWWLTRLIRKVGG